MPRGYATVLANLAATDHVVPAGHRLALIVAGTDAGLIEPADTTPTVIDLARTEARLPLVGGAPAPARADAGTPADPTSAPTLKGVAEPRPQPRLP